MPTDPATGIYEYAESDAVGTTWSGYMNKLATSVKNAIAARPLRQVFTRAGTQSLATGTAPAGYTTVAWTAALVSLAGSFTNSSGTLTCVIAGTYDIEISIPFTGNTTGVRYLELQQNGVTIVDTADVGASSITKNVVTLRKTVVVAATDTLIVRAAQNSGGALTISGCEISLQKIA